MRIPDVQELIAAATPRTFAAPDMAAGSGAPSLGNLTEVTVALGLVLALVFALAWVARRLRVASRPEAPGISVLAEIALGSKERAVLVRVGQAQILLGVAPGRVSRLHALSAEEMLAARAAASDRGESAAESSTASNASSPRFVDLLRRSLGRAP